MNYKKLKTITHRLETADGETVEIRLPANYQAIFDEVRAGKADFATVALYETFIDTYTNYCDHCRQWYQDIANSGKVRTDEMCDLVNIFDVMGKYFCIDNVDSLETLGRLYASMNSLVFNGDKEKVNMHTKHEEFGRAVCEMCDGFFVNGRFYGISNN